MAKKNQQEIQNLDKRLIERIVARGDLSPDDLNGALQKLPDMEGSSEDISSRIYGASSDDGE